MFNEHPLNQRGVQLTAAINAAGIYNTPAFRDEPIFQMFFPGIGRQAKYQQAICNHFDCSLTYQGTFERCINTSRFLFAHWGVPII